MELTLFPFSSLNSIAKDLSNIELSILNYYFMKYNKPCISTTLDQSIYLYVGFNFLTLFLIIVFKCFNFLFQSSIHQSQWGEKVIRIQGKWACLEIGFFFFFLEQIPSGLSGNWQFSLQESLAVAPSIARVLWMGQQSSSVAWG